MKRYNPATRPQLSLQERKDMLNLRETVRAVG
nr:MAG TPA: hypothetical protein [Herelleviridae sp.]